MFTVDPTLPQRDRYQQISEQIRNNSKVIVDFKKKDGELRSMLCTIDPALLPPAVIQEFHKTRPSDCDTITVWCIDKAAWRAFKTDNFISLTPTDK